MAVYERSALTSAPRAFSERLRMADRLGGFLYEYDHKA